MGLPRDENWWIKDRRLEPSHGYRAVHVMHGDHRGTVEVQIRTLLQHQWAELSELFDRISPGTKYGAGAPKYQQILNRESWLIASFEDQEAHAGLIAPEELEMHRREIIELIADVVESGSLEYP